MSDGGINHDKCGGYFNESWLRTALDISASMSMTRSHTDLELLNSRWSVETHTFLLPKESSFPHWRMLVVMFCLL